MAKKRKQPRKERGSALLVSLMIMVGLSLLGLAFVAISETESAISVNERNYTQVQAAAETGARTVVEMFQDATWADSLKIDTTDTSIHLLPKNLTAFKTLRTAQTSDSHGAAVSYTGRYKDGAQELLFDVPFKGSPENRFFGDVDTADVWISATDATHGGAQATKYLTALSNTLFMNGNNNGETLRISEIRVYAPPMPGSTKNANGFFDNGTRYGVATVRVTAQKLVNGEVRAERSVKAVVAETPFPTVDGAIETSGSLVGQGNFNVYWGKILSVQDMQVNRPAVGLPWFDARNIIPFEYGYDSAWPRTANTVYKVGDVVFASAAALAAVGNQNLIKYSYKCTAVTGNATTGNTEPAWSTTIGNQFSDGNVTWTTQAAVGYKYDGTDIYSKYPWFYQLLGRQFEDPWLHARSRQSLVYNNNKTVPCNQATAPHPCDYADPLDDPTLDPTKRYSNFFQFQNTTDSGSKPERVEAVFPMMDYEFWKAVAQSSANTPESGIYYFKYADDPNTGTSRNFQGPGGATHPMEWWLNSAPDANGKPQNGLKPGFYFFDSKNGKNPQFNKGGTLTPALVVNSSSASGNFQIRGYVYMNIVNFGSSGTGKLSWDDVYQMPGEPFLDIGYREVDTTTNKFKTDAALPGGNYSLVGAGDGVFSFQDVNNNGQHDVWTTDITQGGTVHVFRPDGQELPSPTYVPVPWYEGCTVPDPLANPKVVPTAATGCSEPSEPYLNLTYPDKGGAVTSSSANKCDNCPVVEWYDNTIDDATAVKYRKPKVRTGTNSTVACVHDSANGDCTSNSYDKYGALVTIDPILWGVLYNEGGYDGSGNANYYGALLVKGSFSATGTPNVFFDECLALGCLESQLKMQRVTITSFETDNAQ